MMFAVVTGHNNNNAHLHTCLSCLYQDLKYTITSTIKSKSSGNFFGDSGIDYKSSLNCLFFLRLLLLILLSTS